MVTIMPSQVPVGELILKNPDDNNQVRIASTFLSSLGTLYVRRNYGSASTFGPVVTFVQDNSGDDQGVIKFQQDGSGLVIEIEDNGNSNSIQITKVSNSASTVYAHYVSSTNSGAGVGGGIDMGDMANTDIFFKVPVDATDPTGGGAAGTGRILINVGGVNRYLAYY